MTRRGIHTLLTPRASLAPTCLPCAPPITNKRGAPASSGRNEGPTSLASGAEAAAAEAPPSRPSARAASGLSEGPASPRAALEGGESRADAAATPFPMLALRAAARAPRRSALGRLGPDANVACLVVDDDATTRLVVRRVLRRLGGYRVHEAHDGEEALAAVASAGANEAFQLLLVDHQMPRCGGEELLARLQAFLPPRAPRPVVLMMSAVDPHPQSGGGSADTEAQQLEARVAAMGADGFIAKPVTPTALREALRHVDSALVDAPLACDVQTAAAMAVKGATADATGPMGDPLEALAALDERLEESAAAYAAAAAEAHVAERRLLTELDEARGAIRSCVVAMRAERQAKAGVTAALHSAIVEAEQGHADGNRRHGAGQEQLGASAKAVTATLRRLCSSLVDTQRVVDGYDAVDESSSPPPLNHQHMSLDSLDERLLNELVAELHAECGVVGHGEEIRCDATHRLNPTPRCENDRTSCK